MTSVLTFQDIKSRYMHVLHGGHIARVLCSKHKLDEHSFKTSHRDTAAVQAAVVSIENIDSFAGQSKASPLRSEL